MKTKYCPLCKRVRLTKSFNKDIKRYDGLQSTCRPCKHKYDHAWYRSHKEAHYKNTRVLKEKYKGKLTSWLCNYLIKHPCIDCGEQDIIVLEFDHINGKKYKEVSKLVSRILSLDIVKREVEKCVVRCANCHSRRHAIENNNYKYRFMLGRSLNGKATAS